MIYMATLFYIHEHVLQVAWKVTNFSQTANRKVNVEVNNGISKMAQKAHSSVVIFDSLRSVVIFNSSVEIFHNSAVIFHCSSVVFFDSLVLILYGSVVIFKGYCKCGKT